MTREDLRRQFDNEHNDSVPYAASGMFKSSYVEWLEQKIIITAKIVQAKKEIDKLMDACETWCCPKCGSEDIVTTVYCNQCNEAY